MNIIQIVPRLPPASCGVGDCSLILAQALRQQHGVETEFIVGDPASASASAGLPFPVHVLRERNAGALTETITRRTGDVSGIILQYSGYGFSIRGVPLWLLRGLKNLRRQQTQVRLVTMFHELYASGPVTSSAFWLSRLQRHVARGLARLSDSVRSSGGIVSDILSGEMGISPPHLVTLPIFSNLGEAATRLPFADRENCVVIFSSNLGPGVQALKFWEELASCCRSVGADLVCVIGRPQEIPHLEGIKIEQHGFLTPDAASELLARARFAHLSYAPGLLAKSGLFAATAAHGVICILQAEAAGLRDGLQAGTHCLDRRVAESLRSPEDWDRISRRVFDWYQPHSIAATAASFAQSLHAVSV